MELQEWLNKVTKPWGGLEKGKMWDTVKTPPEKLGEDEIKSETGKGKGGDEAKGDEKVDGEVRKGEDKGEKKSENEVEVEKV